MGGTYIITRSVEEDRHGCGEQKSKDPLYLAKKAGEIKMGHPADPQNNQNPHPPALVLFYHLTYAQKLTLSEVVG
jgi:hypothetical protein